MLWFLVWIAMAVINIWGAGNAENNFLAFLHIVAAIGAVVVAFSPWD